MQTRLPVSYEHTGAISLWTMLYHGGWLTLRGLWLWWKTLAQAVSSGSADRNEPHDVGKLFKLRMTNSNYLQLLKKL